MISSYVSWPILCCIAVATVLSGAVLLLIALRLYVYLSMGVCKSKNKMNGKTVIITGCTSGIGRETAKDLARRGAKLIMACRNVDAANKLKGTIYIQYQCVIVYHFIRMSMIPH